MARKAKRTKAQRRAAALESWARRRAAAAMKEVPKWTTPQELADSLPHVRTVYASPVTFSATKEGNDFYLGVSNNGSLHRVKSSPESLRTLALDILRIVG